MEVVDQEDLTQTVIRVAPDATILLRLLVAAVVAQQEMEAALALEVALAVAEMPRHAVVTQQQDSVTAITTATMTAAPEQVVVAAVPMVEQELVQSL